MQKLIRQKDSPKLIFILPFSTEVVAMCEVAIFDFLANTDLFNFLFHPIEPNYSYPDAIFSFNTHLC